jgi:hypothetical protein
MPPSFGTGDSAMKKLAPEFAQILSVKDIREAIDKLKLVDTATKVHTGSMKPLQKIAVHAGRSTYFDSIFGVHVMLDESLAEDEYKIVYQSGREETHKWR